MTATTDSLLLGLYGCCTNPVQWRTTLDQLCQEIGAVSAVLTCVDVNGPVAVPFWQAHDSRMDMDGYRDTVSDARNPRLEASRIRHSAKGPVLQGDEQLFRDEESSIRERLQRQLLDLGLGRFVGGLLPMGDNRYMTLAAHRHPSDTGDFSARELDRLGAVLPHIAQATSLAHTISQSRSASALLDGYLDRWPCALIVCDSERRIHWTNHRADAQLRRGTPLRTGHQLLQATQASAQQSLLRAIERAAAGTEPAFLALDGGDGRLHAVVQSLPARTGRQSDLLLLSISDNSTSGHIPSEALKALFDLTEAEARLASALVAGTTVEQYAQHRGVTVGTARYQLNQVLVKMGAHRQADLVRLVLCSAAAYLTGEARGNLLQRPQGASATALVESSS